MPTERMPETPSQIHETTIKERAQNIVDLQQRQRQERQWSVDQINSNTSLSAAEKTEAIAEVERDLVRRIFPEQKPMMPPTGPIDLAAERGRRRSGIPGIESPEINHIDQIRALQRQEVQRLAMSDATPDEMRSAFQKYEDQIDEWRRRGLVGDHGEIRTDQLGSFEGLIDPDTGRDMKMETVIIETELGEREHQIPESITNKVRMVREALALTERSVEGEGTAGVQQAAKLAQTIIAATQDPRYKQRHHIYKLEGGVQVIDKDEEEKRDKLLNRLYNEYAARSYLNQTYVAYEKADDAGKVNGALSAMRYEWMNTLFKDVPEMKYLLQYYVDHGTEFSEKKDGREDKKAKFQKDALIYAKGKAEKIREEFRTKVIGGDPIPATLYTDEEELRWAQNLAERIWQMMGRRGSQDFTSGFFEEGSLDWGDDPQGGNLVVRKILRWKDWVLVQKKALRPHVELMDGINLDENDFVTQIADKVEAERQAEIIDALKSIDELAVARARATLSDEDKKKDDKVIAAIEKTNNGLLGILDRDDRYKKLKLVHKKKGKWTANTLVSDVTYKGSEAKVKAVRDGKEQIVTINSDVKAKTVNFEEVNWDTFDFRIFGTNPMAYWSYRNLQQPDAARDALIKGPDTFLRMPNDQTLKGAADAISYLSAKQWDQKINLGIRYLELLQSDAAKEAFQEKIPGHSLFEPRGDDRERLLHESTIALLNQLKLNMSDYDTIRKRVVGNQPWAELALAISYARPRKFVFFALLEILEEIGKAVSKDLKVA